MPLTSYEIASGWSQTTRSNIEELIRDAVRRPVTFTLRSQPVADGSVARVTLDQATQQNGTRIVVWEISAIPYAGFERIIQRALGSFSVNSGQVSIKTRNDQNSYSTYNAYLAKPQPNVDYRRGAYGNIIDLRLTFRIVAAY